MKDPGRYFRWVNTVLAIIAILGLSYVIYSTL